jgi:hypothetical protein
MTGADPYDQPRAPVGVLPVRMASGSGRYQLQHAPPLRPRTADPRCPTGPMAAVIAPGLNPEPVAPHPGHQGHLHGDQQSVPERRTRSQPPHRLTPQHPADALQARLILSWEPFPTAQMPLDEPTRPRAVRDTCARGPPQRQCPDIALKGGQVLGRWETELSPCFSSHDCVSCAVGSV